MRCSRTQITVITPHNVDSAERAKRAVRHLEKRAYSYFRVPFACALRHAAFISHRINAPRPFDVWAYSVCTSAGKPLALEWFYFFTVWTAVEVGTPLVLELISILNDSVNKKVSIIVFFSISGYRKKWYFIIQTFQYLAIIQRFILISKRNAFVACFYFFFPGGISRVRAKNCKERALCSFCADIICAYGALKVSSRRDKEEERERWVGAAERFYMCLVSWIFVFRINSARSNGCHGGPEIASRALHRLHVPHARWDATRLSERSV